eukprot:CAMPEP_0206445064 /NCGR_PEP_ID=MMETSP0324_2-20121206/15274_1 /ASSEMBLY_ACC=CAM_ASM_000836 /TAXON_ID=2866 /ORGANISM="Crypthecodinium cohnii, Strain Seligo" /LENGTH=366 /DNA_ID=CAMNT_0053913185 /DNA_START=86 /DNA_END=1186 /DNA_ORIENTATION=+
MRRSVAALFGSVRKVPTFEEAIKAKASVWNLDASSIEASMSMWGSDGNRLLNDANDDLWLFLYAKHLGCDWTTQERKEMFRDLIFTNNTKNLGRRQRLEAIIVKGETSTNETNTFENFLAKSPKWNTSESYVAFRDHPKLKHVGLLERLQNSGICYMHASVLVQAYAIGCATGKFEGMLDLAAFFRKHETRQALENHIFQDQGGSSTRFLENILDTDPQLVKRFTDVLFHPVNFQRERDDVLRDLKQYGPALVSQFQVVEDFHVGEQYAHTGKTECGKVVGLHAMALVGHRVDDVHGDMYLLQNWWANKPFVEVDAEYLHCCQPVISFVASAQTTIPKRFKFSTNPHRHAELQLSLAECMPPLERN